jgi:hypothetical protein
VRNCNEEQCSLQWLHRVIENAERSGKLEVICQRSCGIDWAIAGRATAAAAPPAAAVKKWRRLIRYFPSVATDGGWKCRRAIVAAAIQIL